MSLSDRFPRWASGIMTILQLAFALALIGLEIGSVYVDLAHGTIWIGFWAGLVFLYTAIVMCGFTICCHNRYYGICALIWSIVCIALSGVVIYFNNYFIDNLCTCYLSDSLCCSVRGIPYFSSNYSSAVTACATLSGNALKAASCPGVPYEKLPYVKAQLAIGVGMMVVCAIYIVVFVLSCLGIWPKKDK